MTLGRDLSALLRDLSLKAVSLALERGSRLLVTVASASVLGEVAFGQFVFATTATALLALAADLGLGIWTTRALARQRDDGRAVVTAGLALRAMAAVPYGVVLVAFAGFGLEGDLRKSVILLGVAALCNGIADHFGSIFRGSGRFSEETRLNATRAALTATAGLLALAFGRSLLTLCLALAGASVGALVQGVAGVLRVHPLRPGGAAWRPLVRVAFREALPIWLASLLSLLYFKIDTFFVRAFAGDAELGAYGAAYKLFEGSMLLPAVVLAATFPRLSALHDDLPARKQLELRIGATLLALGALVGGALFVARGPLVDLVFGASFAGAARSLETLAIGVPLVYLNFGLTHFLVARDREGVNTWLALMMLVVTVVLDVLLIPEGGGPGAARATVLAEVALTGGCLLMLWVKVQVGSRS